MISCKNVDYFINSFVNVQVGQEEQKTNYIMEMYFLKTS